MKTRECSGFLHNIAQLLQYSRFQTREILSSLHLQPLHSTRALTLLSRRRETLWPVSPVFSDSSPSSPSLTSSPPTAALSAGAPWPGGLACRFSSPSSSSVGPSARRSSPPSPPSSPV